MPADRFLIGYVDNNSGLKTNTKPWLLPDNAFANLENAYVFRGRVRKRFGSVLMGESQLESRLRYQVTTTNGSGAASGTVPGAVFEVGQMFSVGTAIFTVSATGTPANLLSTTAATMTYNTSNGAYTVTGADATAAVFFYPATPVMGLTQYFIPSTRLYDTIGFDTQFCYKFDESINSWQAITSGAATWTGTDANFFWSINYQPINNPTNYLWTTNYFPADGIRYYNGSTWTKPVLNWTVGSLAGTTDGSGNASSSVAGTFFIGQVFTVIRGNVINYFTVTATGLAALQPSAGSTGTGTFDTGTGAYTFTGALANANIYFSGNNSILTCLLMIKFQNRMLLLNTIENVSGSNTLYDNRMRYSAYGDPLTPYAFMQDVAGGGGYLDAPTSQPIVTAQFIKDRLIVYFTESTFELAYTGNQIQPFTWQRINTELGAESPFSEIPFDRQVFGIDNVGIHKCNGANVERIDESVPQFAFGISNVENGIRRVVGIRDYYTELVYWSYPNQVRSTSFYFPNKILVYNYINDSWATFDDTITFFGYFLFLETTPGATWGDTHTPWQELTMLWNSGADTQSNTKVKSVLAGNQQGFTFVVRPNVTSNAASLQITNATSSGDGQLAITSINHNLMNGDFVLLSNMTGLTFTDSNSNVLTSVMGRVQSDPFNSDTPDSFSLLLLDNENEPMAIAGTYAGGGVAARVSNIDILTKQYNFYTDQDRNCYVSKIDFLVDKTDIGAVSVNFLTSSSSSALLSGSPANGSFLGTNALETHPYALSNFEKFQNRLWHPLYFFAEGECVQFNINMSGQQMFDYVVDPNGKPNFVALQDFQLNAMVIYAQPTSSRMQ